MTYDIALMEVIGRHCYECSGEAAYHVTEWTEVSDEGYRALQRYISKKTKQDRMLLILHKPYTSKQVLTTVEAALIELQEDEAQSKAEKQKRLEKKLKEQEGKERKKYKELKEKFEK